MKPAYMEAAQELHSKNVCIHIATIGGKITFPNIAICNFKGWRLARTQGNYAKRKNVAIHHGGGDGNVGQSQVDPSSLSSVLPG